MASADVMQMSLNKQEANLPMAVTDLMRISLGKHQAPSAAKRGADFYCRKGGRLAAAARVKAAPKKTLPCQEVCTQLDADGERLLICPHCRLPIGDRAYSVESREGTLFHGECLAQIAMKELQECSRHESEQVEASQRLRNEQYGIGWSVEHMPRVPGAVSNLGGDAAPQKSSIGWCCLVLDEETHTLSLAHTDEPSAGVNLEYLSLALRVQRDGGEAPFFSLDPANPKDLAFDKTDGMQVKRFQPEWLAGTSAGEVMFQADVYLKELSMGQHPQPVVGMLSGLDYACEQDDLQAKWLAREWFFINSAEVHLSEDNVLVPHVKMAVEAREISAGDRDIRDKAITRPDHPLVKYAEAFTRNFDLIAERKSVIYHLRELAKATVLARFLFSAEVHLDDAWFNLAGEAKGSTAQSIPQLWNQRHTAVLELQDGQIVDLDPQVGSRMLAVFGGVSFGMKLPRQLPVRAPLKQAKALSKFRQLTVVAHPHLEDTLPPAIESRDLLQVIQVPAAIAQALAPAAPKPMAPVGVPGAPGAPRLQQRMIARGRLNVKALAARALPQERQLVPVRPAVALAPLGVDLTLDELDLTKATPEEGSYKIEEGTTPFQGNTFWEELADELSSLPAKQDRKVLMALFDPSMSDRRIEGDLFMPPGVDAEYLSHLRELLRKEESVAQRRKELFSSPQFKAHKPPPEFPSTWALPFRVLQDSPERVLHEREAASVPIEILQTLAPEFERRAEDGTMFRIFRVGTDLEVRTVQEPGEEQLVHAVFSIVEGANAQDMRIYGHETVVKVSEFVEKMPTCQEASNAWAYYATLETEMGSTVLTQLNEEGEIAFQENPVGLELRNSLAKVLRSSSCGEADRSVADARAFANQYLEGRGIQPVIGSKAYAKGMFTWLIGQDKH